MRSPFDDHGDGVASHVVLTDDAGRHSLWPAFAAVPDGWRATLPPADHRSCLTHVERTTTGPLRAPEDSPGVEPATAPPGAPQ